MTDESCTVYLPRQRSNSAAYVRYALTGVSGVLLIVATVALWQTKAQEPSFLDQSTIFNSGGHKLAEGLADALKKAAATDPLKYSKEKAREEEKDEVAKPSNLFNPQFDADAPSSKFSRYLQKEKEMKQLQDRMDKQLKLKAKVAMLTSRETTSLAAMKDLSKGHTKSTAKETVAKKEAATGKAKVEKHKKAFKAWSDIKPMEDKEKEQLEGYESWTKGPPKRPGFKEISEAVQKALQNGDDPSKLLAKEGNIEKKYAREMKEYKTWKAKFSQDMDGEE